MKKIIVIGTLHAGITPHEELATLLDTYRPEVILVEITQFDLETNNVQKYPDEMIYAVSRAKKRKIPVFGFDSPIDTLAKGKNKKDNEKAIQGQKKILQKYSWKDANRKEVEKLLETPEAQQLVDKVKERERKQEMVNNIKRIYNPQKKTIVITGTGHLEYFEKHLPEATFPLR